jgi:hypothetical protein
MGHRSTRSRKSAVEIVLSLVATSPFCVAFAKRFSDKQRRAIGAAVVPAVSLQQLAEVPRLCCSERQAPLA